MKGGMKGGGSHWHKLISMAQQPGTKLTVKEVSGGVSLTLTSDDEKSAERLKKLGEIIRLNHELNQEEKAEREKRREERKKKREERKEKRKKRRGGDSDDDESDNGGKET